VITCTWWTKVWFLLWSVCVDGSVVRGIWPNFSQMLKKSHFIRGKTEPLNVVLSDVCKHHSVILSTFFVKMASKIVLQIEMQSFRVVLVLINSCAVWFQCCKMVVILLWLWHTVYHCRLCRVKCKTITECSIATDSRIDSVHFELDVVKLLHRCQCVKMLFSALQIDSK